MCGQQCEENNGVYDEEGYGEMRSGSVHQETCSKPLCIDVVLFKTYDPAASSVADALIDTIDFLLLSFHRV